MNPTRTALLLVDLQNDFLHPDGAYARGGAASADLVALPARLAPVARTLKSGGACWSPAVSPSGPTRAASR